MANDVINTRSANRVTDLTKAIEQQTVLVNGLMAAMDAGMCATTYRLVHDRHAVELDLLYTFIAAKRSAIGG